MYLWPVYRSPSSFFFATGQKNGIFERREYDFRTLTARSGLEKRFILILVQFFEIFFEIF
jgi:hypothetical protein